MGEVHDIIEARGKAAALRSELDREVVEAAARYMADEDPGIGFLYSGWCQAALPHRRLPASRACDRDRRASWCRAACPTGAVPG